MIKQMKFLKFLIIIGLLVFNILPAYAAECDPSQQSCVPGTTDPRDGSINGFCDPSQQSCLPGTVGPGGTVNSGTDSGSVDTQQGTSGTPSSGNTNPGGTAELKNPIGIDNLEDLANKIGGVLVDLAIPIAVIMIIWSGVQFLIAAGNSEMITKAKNTLKWAIIGLAVIFIGKGFITLIQDILSLKDK